MEKFWGRVCWAKHHTGSECLASNAAGISNLCYRSVQRCHAVLSFRREILISPQIETLTKGKTTSLLQHEYWWHLDKVIVAGILRPQHFGNNHKGFSRAHNWVVVSFPCPVAVLLNVDLGAELLRIKNSTVIWTFPCICFAVRYNSFSSWTRTRKQQL